MLLLEHVIIWECNRVGCLSARRNLKEDSLIFHAKCVAWLPHATSTASLLPGYAQCKEQIHTHPTPSDSWAQTAQTPRGSGFGCTVTESFTSALHSSAKGGNGSRTERSQRMRKTPADLILSFQLFLGRASHVSSSVGVFGTPPRAGRCTVIRRDCGSSCVPPITPRSAPLPSSAFYSDSTFHLGSTLWLGL